MNPRTTAVFRNLFVLPFFVLGSASCSLRIAHDDGSVTHLGLVNLREGRAGEMPLVHSRRLGLMFDVGTSSNGAAVGYDDRLVVLPPGDAVTEVEFAPGADPFVRIKRTGP